LTNISVVIESFGDKQTEKLWHGKRTRFPSDLLQRAIDKLNILDAVSSLETLRIPPNNRLEALRGDRAGQYSIRINDQWRICFLWEAGSARQVEITDYH
jgi:toxin HigB-1